MNLLLAASFPAICVILIVLSVSQLSDAIRSFPDLENLPRFAEAPEYRNGGECLAIPFKNCVSSCNPSHVHVAMTLDKPYLRGSVAAVHSVLKHASCPENIFFHFIVSAADYSSTELNRLVRSTFPSLNFKLYPFDSNQVQNLISTSIRSALEQPLNYARTYLADILEPCVDRVIYLDSDLIVVDDISKLWNITLSRSRVIGAPEYCHANFTNYFSDEFWSDPEFSDTFSGRQPCYFNTGVMVMDLARWREGRFREKIEGWMEVQKARRIYELGSLPPFLLVFSGDVEAVDHRWNQHGLGGDNVARSCRDLHPGPVSLLHWSGRGKPWVRFDAKTPCPLDHLWAPYDLYLAKW